MTTKSAPHQAALRARRKAEGLKTLTRYVKPGWIVDIDELIEKLKKKDSS